MWHEVRARRVRTYFSPVGPGSRRGAPPPVARRVPAASCCCASASADMVARRLR